MKKLLFTLATLLIASNAMADRVVTFDPEVDDMEFSSELLNVEGDHLGDFWKMSKDGVSIYMFSLDGKNPCRSLDDGDVYYYYVPQTNIGDDAFLTVYSELYYVDDDAPSYERYYGGISKIEFTCNPGLHGGPNALYVMRPNGYPHNYSTEGTMGYYVCENDEGYCPQFVDFGLYQQYVKIYEISVTLYGVDSETPDDPVLPTPRMKTVCDGNDWSTYVPVYGYYYDSEGTTSQMIYPAEMIDEMQGGKITQVKFYVDGTTNFGGGKLQLALKSTDQLLFETATAITGAEAVATIVPEKGITELVFDLDEPFEYTGDNLLIETLVLETGDYGSAYFTGTNVGYNASLYHYYWWYDNDYTSQFLPKVTFTYEISGTPTPPEPTEKTGAPVFNGYTTDGIHAYFVEILPTDEGSVIYYRILYPGEEEYTEWAIYEEILSFEGDGKHRVEAYAVAPNKLPSEQIAYEFVVEPEPLTGISEMMNGKTVAGVRYFNMAGQEMTEANGLTIVVTTYTDGTTSAVKVVK